MREKECHLANLNGLLFDSWTIWLFSVIYCDQFCAFRDGFHLFFTVRCVSQYYVYQFYVAFHLFKTISWPTVYCMSQISDFRQFLHTFLSDYLSCQPCIKLIHHKIILFSNAYLSKEEFYASRNRLRQKTSPIIGSDRQVESWPLNQQYITSRLTQFSFCLHDPDALLVKMTHSSCMF